MGDFGLAEDVYASGYFRQNDRANVKVPYKWMALESLNDAIFTEKTDVVSQCMAMVDQYGLISTPENFKIFCAFIGIVGIDLRMCSINYTKFTTKHEWTNIYSKTYIIMLIQWSYGVTVWEVFNGGRTPYPAVDPLSLIQLLGEGRRLERPLTAACATEM